MKGPRRNSIPLIHPAGWLGCLGMMLCLLTPWPLQAKSSDDQKESGKSELPSKTKADKSPMVGIWEGTLNVGGIQLRLGFHIKQKEDGTFIGTMDSIDQGARNIPLSSVKVEGKQVTLEFKLGRMTYTAKLSDDQQKLAGTFEQHGQTFPLILNRMEKATVLVRPQEPKPPFPYKAVDISVENPKAEKVKLAGTLTLPEGKGPFKAVILISGSGPQNRDEEILGHKPFWVIADYLTRQGVAVLRFDDRGVAKSTGNFAQATTADFATDVEALFNYLKTRPEIDPKRIGLMGHSEGGLIAPMVAAACPDIGFIVLLAGPGTRGDVILRGQRSLISKANHISDKANAQSEKILEKLVAILREEKDEKATREKMMGLIEEVLKQMSEEDRAEVSKQLAAAGFSGDEAKLRSKQDDFIRNQFKASIERMNNPWFRYFVEYDPQPTLKQVKCPVLAVNGELDLQVPCQENLKAIADAVKAGGNHNVTTKAFPKLNHLFQKTETGNPAEYGHIEETFSPEVLQFIGDWIKRLNSADSK